MLCYMLCSENESQVITDLEMWREVQLCTASPPHSCEEFYNTGTEEEYEILEKWNTPSREQAGGSRRRPDLECDEDGFYPHSFWCSLLQKIRPHSENLRSEDGNTQDVSCPPSSPLPSLREEPERQEDNELFLQISRKVKQSGVNINQYKYDRFRERRHWLRRPSWLVEEQ